MKLKPRDTLMNLFSCFHGDGKFCLTSVWLIDSGLGRAGLAAARAHVFMQVRGSAWRPPPSSDGVFPSLCRDEAEMEYLKIAQDLEMYGVNYFTIRVCGSP